MEDSGSLGLTFTVSEVSKEFTSSTFLNVLKRRETIAYYNALSASAANIAYIVSEDISPTNNLRIVDRSTSLVSNRGISIDEVEISSANQFTIEVENFLVTDISVTDNTGTVIPLFYQHVIDSFKLPRTSDTSDRTSQS